MNFFLYTGTILLIFMLMCAGAACMGVSLFFYVYAGVAYIFLMNDVLYVVFNIYFF